MRALLTDLRLAARTLRRSPTFTLAVVLTLAIGLGANAAMFSATYNLLLEPLPFPDPSRLVALQTIRAGQPPQRVSLADLLDWQSQSRSFTRMAAYRLRSFALRSGRGTGDTPVSVIQVGQVTHGFFPVLGVEPALGRTFSRDEEIGEAPVIVVGDALWRQHLGADPGIVGHKVFLNDEPRTVVGVLPPGFGIPIQGKIPEAYVPLSHQDYGDDRSLRSLSAIARLRPGAPPAGARTELAAVGARLARAFPETNEGVGATAEPLHEALRGKNRLPLLLLSGAALALLLIAAVNVANLLIVRVLTQSRALAIRSALGARGGHLGRQFFAEGLILTLLGAALGLWLARTFLQTLPLVLPLFGGLSTDATLALAPLRLDAPALLLTLALCILLSLMFGLLPVSLARRLQVDRLLRDDLAPSSWRARLRGALVAGQIALSTLLLLSSGLLLRSFFAVLTTDPGFRSAEVAKFGLGLPEARYDTEAKIIAFHRDLLARLREIPGLEAAGAALSLPLGGRAFNTAFQEAGAGLPPREWPDASLNVASPGFFSTLDIPLLAGRPFSERDTPGTPRVLLVNRAFERRYFPGRRAVGARLEIGWESELNPVGTLWEVVGVVGDIRQKSLEEAAVPEIYLPMSQFPIEGCTYVVRSARQDAGLAAALRAAVIAEDNQLEQIEVLPFTEVLRESVGDRRLMLLLTCAFAAVSLLLTALGLYGVVAFTVAESTREIAVRMALGIRPRQVVGLVVGQGLRLAAAGLSLGALGFFFVSKVLLRYLYGVGPADLPTAVAAVLLLGLVTCLACAAPALQARRIAPARLLREV